MEHIARFLGLLMAASSHVRFGASNKKLISVVLIRSQGTWRLEEHVVNSLTPNLMEYRQGFYANI